MTDYKKDAKLLAYKLEKAMEFNAKIMKEYELVSEICKKLEDENKRYRKQPLYSKHD